eukprot:29586-Pelagococcus_subviridis.AAC.10
MAAEQTEKAYQKQLGVNAGCVLAHDFASPRRSRVVSDARRRRIVVFSAPLPRNSTRVLTPSPASSLVSSSGSPSPLRTRRPARLAPAITSPWVSVSRPRARLSRVRARSPSSRDARLFLARACARSGAGPRGIEGAGRDARARRDPPPSPPFRSRDGRSSRARRREDARVSPARARVATSALGRAPPSSADLGANAI